MSDAYAKGLTARIRTQSIEFSGPNLGDLQRAAETFAEYSGLDLFSTNVQMRDGVTCMVATYTNPEIPWLSPDEPPMVTFRSGEQN